MSWRHEQIKGWVKKNPLFWKNQVAILKGTVSRKVLKLSGINVLMSTLIPECFNPWGHTVPFQTAKTICSKKRVFFYSPFKYRIYPGATISRFIVLPTKLNSWSRNARFSWLNLFAYPTFITWRLDIIRGSLLSNYNLNHEEKKLYNIPKFFRKKNYKNKT